MARKLTKKLGVTRTNTNKIQTFVNGCLRRILRLRWYDRVTNTDLWIRTGQEPDDPGQEEKMAMDRPYLAEDTVECH